MCRVVCEVESVKRECEMWMHSDADKWVVVRQDSRVKMGWVAGERQKRGGKRGCLKERTCLCRKRREPSFRRKFEQFELCVPLFENLVIV